MKNKMRNIFIIFFAYYTLFFGKLSVYAEETESLISCGDFEGLISDAFRFFKILAPILLILFGSLDFAGAVVKDDGDMKEAGTKFAKRLAAAALVYIIPTLLSIVLGFAVEKGILPQYLECWF